MKGEDIAAVWEAEGDAESPVILPGKEGEAGPLAEEDSRARTLKAWRAGWKAPFKMPTTEPDSPPSILRHGDVDAGPYRGSAGILAGAGAVGKSWAALDLAVMVAAGATKDGATKWLGFEVVASGRVVYVAAEDPAEVLGGRLYRLATKLDEEQRARLKDRLHVVALADADPELLRVWRIARQMNPDEARAAGVAVSWKDEGGEPVPLRSPSVAETKTIPSEFLKTMAEDLKTAKEADKGVALVVLDPLSRLGGSDAETDNAVAARLMRALGGLAADAGAAVIVVHHTTKAARKPGEKPTGTGIRGASALSDGARWTAEMIGDEEGSGVTLSVSKTSYGRGVAPVRLVRETWGGLREENEGEAKGRETAAAASVAAKNGKAGGAKAARADQSKSKNGKGSGTGANRTREIGPGDSHD